MKMYSKHIWKYHSILCNTRESVFFCLSKSNNNSFLATKCLKQNSWVPSRTSCQLPNFDKSNNPSSKALIVSTRYLVNATSFPGEPVPTLGNCVKPANQIRTADFLPALASFVCSMRQMASKRAVGDLWVFCLRLSLILEKPAREKNGVTLKSYTVKGATRNSFCDLNSPVSLQSSQSHNLSDCLLRRDKGAFSLRFLTWVRPSRFLSNGSTTSFTQTWPQAELGYLLMKQHNVSASTQIHPVLTL